MMRQLGGLKVSMNPTFNKKGKTADDKAASTSGKASIDDVEMEEAPVNNPENPPGGDDDNNEDQGNNVNPGGPGGGGPDDPLLFLLLALHP